MWIQWLWNVPLRGQEVVCLNIDETPVFRQMQPRKGYVIAAHKRWDRNCFARVALRDRRGQSTVLGLISNSFELQRVLPQFILTNDANVSNADKARLRILPPPLRWVVGTKGWVTAPILLQLFTEIRKSIRTLKPKCQIVLFMDCATIHTALDVLKHCSRLGIHVVLIPGGMTYLCQPLDSHVFATFKKTLAELQEEDRGSNALGIMNPNAWVGILAAALRRSLVEKDWSMSFSENGLEGNYVGLRSRIAEGLGPHLPLPLRLPTRSELAFLLGRSRSDVADWVFRASERLAARPPLSMPFPLTRLPPAPFVARAACRGAASSSEGPPPPLPPPAADAEPDSPPTPLGRFTRSGTMY